MTPSAAPTANTSLNRWIFLTAALSAVSGLLYVAAPEQLGGQPRDVVGGGHREDRAGPLLEPRRERSEQPGGPRVGTLPGRAPGEGLLDLVHPEGQRRVHLRDLQGPGQALLGPVPAAEDPGEVEPDQGHAELGRGGLRRQRLPAALHAEEQDAARGREATGRRSELSSAVAELAGTLSMCGRDTSLSVRWAHCVAANTPLVPINSSRPGIASVGVSMMK